MPSKKPASKKPAKEKRPFRAGTVALVGRPNVGKSTLLNVVLGEKIAIVSHHPQTTRQRLLGVYNDDDTQIVFVDTPGMHVPRHRLGVRMQHEAVEALRDADVVLVVADARHEPDSDLLKEVPEGPNTLLALNKIDLVQPKEKLFPRLEAWTKARDFAAIIPISAKTKSGLPRVISEIRERLAEGDALFDREMLTDKPIRFLVAEFVREQILMRTRQEVPHGIAVTVDRYEEDAKRGPKIALTVHVTKESHKKIVVGRGGAALKAVGIAARHQIERLLRTRAHITIWVRVTPDWVDDPKALGELGFESS